MIYGVAPLPPNPRLDPVIRWLDHPLIDHHACDPIHVLVELPLVGDVRCGLVPWFYRRGDVGEDESGRLSFSK